MQNFYQSNDSTGQAGTNDATSFFAPTYSASFCNASQSSATVCGIRVARPVALAALAAGFNPASNSSALSGELQIRTTSQPAFSAALAPSSTEPAEPAAAMLKSSLKITPLKPIVSRRIV